MTKRSFFYTGRLLTVWKGPTASFSYVPVSVPPRHPPPGAKPNKSQRSSFLFLHSTLNSYSHQSTDRLTELSHAAGTVLRTHVDVRKLPLGLGCLSFQFRSSVLSLFSAVVRACGLVVLPLLLCLCSLFHRSWRTCVLGMYFSWLVWRPQVILINRVAPCQGATYLPSDSSCTYVLP
jgi:hypothetical protein